MKLAAILFGLFIAALYVLVTRLQTMRRSYPKAPQLRNDWEDVP